MIRITHSMKGALPLTPTVFYYMYEATCYSQSPLQLLVISTVKLLYNVQGKGWNPDGKPCPFPYVFRNPYRNLTSKNSQDYGQKPQQNSASESVTWVPLWGLAKKQGGRHRIVVPAHQPMYCSLATQFQTRFLELIPPPIAVLKVSHSVYCIIVNSRV